VQREFASFALAGGVINFLVDTANDLAQKIIFRLKNAFAKHIASSAGFVSERILAQSLSGENLRQ
jgi:hypothetical protein